ncbi:glycoside hydrolase family 99-like domain-containing protein [Lacrimispora sp.]|uniref:glycoside hydrolase family 99-like domain-containing protein n=1 Tax=Lacrimispora sp. TaxID=2719234 RepID=UPI002897E090|nr:glycoside hydrolase family 99-like domain-containing protein [Lacrimispora sp.]
MQVLAMYLPQFHNVEENNLWWGEGFTEWTAVKDARKLFEGHEQPKVPHEKNYYDLLNKDTMIWQSDLMKKYSVDGMCMYHYWFKDGRQILEKPAENLLKWKDIDMPFCFSWANETWARSWSNIREKNVWANTFENKEINKNLGILLEQKYGLKEDWEKHFNYLLPFFQDKRYIKIDGKPLFLIYQASIIPCIKDMLELWRRLSKEAGLPGLYIIGSNCNVSAKNVVDAVLYTEPGRSKGMLKKLDDNQIHIVDYETIWNRILKTKKTSKKTFLGAFVGYDDTPRRGIEGAVITNATPQKFCYYLAEIMAKNAAWNNDLLFLNAWNEWGEGMYLEPDDKYGYQYLEAILQAKKIFSDRIIEYNDDIKDLIPYNTKEILDLQEKSDKYEHYLNLLDDWMKLREKGVCLTGFLENAGFYNIGIYGLGILGRHFLREISDSNIQVSYIVDQQRDRLHVDIPVYLPTEELPDVDAIIVASTFYYPEIIELLKEKEIKNIISLEMIIRECE